MIPSHARNEVHTAFHRCQRRYPTIQLAFETFAAKVGEVMESLGFGSNLAVIPGHQSWVAAFSGLHHEDLFLATACAAGDRIAWEYFVDDYEPLLRKLAVRACRNSSDGEDLAQEILLGLLGAPEQHSRLQSYNGRGSLAGWLRVTVARAAIDRFRREKKQVSLDELEQQGTVPEAAVDSGSAEAPNASLDARWGPVLSRLVAAELEQLPARDRLLLNLYYLQGIPLRAIGEHFGVHEGTASRWLDSLRKGIRKRVERELRTRHGLQARDLKSIWLWISEEKRELPLEKLLAE